MDRPSSINIIMTTKYRPLAAEGNGSQVEPGWGPALFIVVKMWEPPKGPLCMDGKTMYAY